MPLASAADWPPDDEDSKVQPLDFHFKRWTLEQRLLEHCMFMKEVFPTQLDSILNDVAQRICDREAGKPNARTKRTIRAWLQQMSLTDIRQVAQDRNLRHDSLRITSHMQYLRFPLAVHWQGPYMGVHFAEVPIRYVHRVYEWCCKNVEIAEAAFDVELLLRYHQYAPPWQARRVDIPYLISQGNKYGQIPDNIVAELTVTPQVTAMVAAIKVTMSAHTTPTEGQQRPKFGKSKRNRR